MKKTQQQVLSIQSTKKKVDLNDCRGFVIMHGDFIHSITPLYGPLLQSGSRIGGYGGIFKTEVVWGTGQVYHVTVSQKELINYIEILYEDSQGPELIKIGKEDNIHHKSNDHFNFPSRSSEMESMTIAEGVMNFNGYHVQCITSITKIKTKGE